jgi:hypothetical protein
LTEITFITRSTFISIFIFVELVTFAETNLFVNIFDLDGIAWLTCRAEVLGFAVDTGERAG